MSKMLHCIAETKSVSNVKNILGGSSTLMKVLGVCKGSSSWTTMPMNLRIRS